MSNTKNGGAGAATAPLAENEHVKELLGILQENGKDTTGLTALLTHVDEMENFVKMAESRIADMKSQLDTMKEVQDHPIKNTLQKTIKALETKVAEIKEQIVQLRLDIAGGCIAAINAFKEKGAAALDRLASFFNIKSSLLSLNKNIDDSIKLDDKAIVKIEVFSKEYHTAGRHLKNMGRVLTGKPPIDAVKEAGILAKAACAPYKADKAIMLKMKNAVAKMVVRLEQLEQKMAEKREEKAVAQAANPPEKKPSLAEKLKEHRELIKQKDLERALPERKRTPGIEV
jgi:predicted ArsR family transcriptional regulator